MTATDTVARLDQAPTATVQLPPFSGSDAVCAKCLYPEAFTRYRPATQRVSLDRGPLPEHLERECARCDYTWREALAVDTDGMSVEALAHALHRACPYPVELDRDAREDIARELLQMLRVSARPEHPVWQYDDGRPPTPALTTCEAPHLTDTDEDACERRRAGLPVATTKENTL